MAFGIMRVAPSAPGGGGGPVALAGDLSGNTSAATVIGLRGIAIAVTAPATGQSYVYNAATNEWVPTLLFKYYVSSAAAAAAAPHVNGIYVVIDPGSPTSEAGTYQITANGGASFPADYSKVSDRTDTASEVGVVDAGNYFAPTNVEDILQDIGAGIGNALSAALLVATVAIDSVPAAVFGGGDWELLLVNGNLRYKSIVSVTHDGTDTSVIESNIVTGPGVGVVPVTIDADINAGNLRILATATSLGWSYRLRRLALLPV